MHASSFIFLQGVSAPPPLGPDQQMEEAALLLESHRVTVVDEPGQERYSHAMGVIAQLVAAQAIPA